MSGAPPALPADAELRRDPRTGAVRMLRARDLSAGLAGADAELRRALAEHQPGDAALRFLAGYRTLFALADPERELSVESVRAEPGGRRHVRLAQSHQGIPVYGAELLVHLDDTGVYLVQGHYLPTPRALDTTPRLSAAQARAIAARAIEAPGAAPRFRASLTIFAADGAPRLAYRIDAPVDVTEGWTVVVAADDGEVLHRASTVQTSGPMRVAPD